jgi:hypothetical protein
MHLGATLVADEQPLEVVQPGEGALDHPAIATEPGTMHRLAASDHRLDPASAEQPAMLVVVVAAVGDHALGAPPRPADGAAHRWHRFEERDQLGDVVAIAAGERPGERESRLVDEEVVL